MSLPDDPELETLLKELAPDETSRAALLEEHRQLEKDLLRLADPLPPPDFLANVMARVATAPPRAMSRGEVWGAAAVVFGALAAALVTFLVSGGVTGGFGVSVASVVLTLRDGVVAFGSALAALWTTAALPLVVALSMLLVGSLAALRRFAGSSPAKAVT